MAQRKLNELCSVSLHVSVRATHRFDHRVKWTKSTPSRRGSIDRLTTSLVSIISGGLLEWQTGIQSSEKDLEGGQRNDGA